MYVFIYNTEAWKVIFIKQPVFCSWCVEWKGKQCFCDISQHACVLRRVRRYLEPMYYASLLVLFGTVLNPIICAGVLHWRALTFSLICGLTSVCPTFVPSSCLMSCFLSSRCASVSCTKTWIAVFYRNCFMHVHFLVLWKLLILFPLPGLGW